jgi:hypothetical protein
VTSRSHLSPTLACWACPFGKSAQPSGTVGFDMRFHKFGTHWVIKVQWHLILPLSSRVVVGNEIFWPLDSTPMSAPARLLRRYIRARRKLGFSLIVSLSCSSWTSVRFTLKHMQSEAPSGARFLTTMDLSDTGGESDLDSFFSYTSGRWLYTSHVQLPTDNRYNERQRLAERYLRFDVAQLTKAAVNSTGHGPCTSIVKMAEGGASKVFLIHGRRLRSHCETSHSNCWPCSLLDRK